MLGLSHNLTKTVFVYLCICVHLCIWICVFGCQTRGNIVFEVLVRFPFQKYITSWVFSGFLDVLDVLDVLDDLDVLDVLDVIDVLDVPDLAKVCSEKISLIESYCCNG